MMYLVKKSKIMKKAFLFVVIIFALIACQKKAETPPNIIFIFSDDHALNAISAYSDNLISTPSIDRLASEGMLFTNCFCANSICAPSRATVLTGKYSHMNGVRDNADRFDSSQVTFPKLLQQHGYQTAILGKWHLKSQPTGFDYWEVLPDQGDYYNPTFITATDTTRYSGYATRIITDKGMDWLERRDKSRPFLLMVQHKAPHRNWMPEVEKVREYSQKTFPEPATLYEDYSGSIPRSTQEMTIAHHMIMDYDLKIPTDSLMANDPAGEPMKPEWWSWDFSKLDSNQQKAWKEAMGYRTHDYRERHLTGKALTAWKYQQYMRDYLGCIESVDENVGRLLDYLDQQGLAENTIVVYSSDQGFYLGEHGWFDKRWMYEESLHMPFIIRYPENIAPGSVSDEMIQNIDFAPTFLDYAGVAVTEDMQGKSFRSILTGGQQGPFRDEIYYHYYEYPAVHMVMKHYGIRTERYKLIHFYEQDIWELYDLKNDPHEMNNLVADPAHQELLDSLKDRLAALKKTVGE